MSRYKPYLKYKDSGVEWLGEVPEHWVIIQSRRLFKERKERAVAGDEQLTASQKYGIISQQEFMELEGRSVVQVITGSEILKRAYDNDFVISMRSFQGGLEWCRRLGSMSSAYIALIPIKHIVPKFFAYLLKSKPYIQALQSTSNLVRDGQALRFENFSFVDLLIIPDEEQQAIADFLDRETAKIDALVAKQERMIELLKEKIVSLAMSEQINGQGCFERIGNLINLISRPAIIDNETEYETLGLYNRGRGIFHKLLKLGNEMGDSDFFYVESGDLILSGQFAWEGAVALAQESENNCVVSHRYPIFRGSKVKTEYLAALLMTDFGDFILNESSRGAAGRNKPLNIGLLLNEKIRIPSSGIQNQIAELIHSKAIIEKKAKQAIELLKERRTALISAAVTGKIDVRGAL